jgi:hypothetical protein
MDEDDSPSLPPRKGDLLFRDDLPDWHNNACLNVAWGNDRAAYTEGYRRGAQLLVAHVVEHARNQDYLVYPVIFLYRHHIELALKNIVMQTPHLMERELTDPERSHLGKHRLDLLWTDVKSILRELSNAVEGSELASDEVEGIDDYIAQLSAMDPDSFAFRYAHAKSGTPSLDPELKRINLRHFAELMERLANYLDGIDAALYSLAEGKAEMEAEYRREMSYYEDYA